MSLLPVVAPALRGAVAVNAKVLRTVVRSANVLNRRAAKAMRPEEYTNVVTRGWCGSIDDGLGSDAELGSIEKSVISR